MTRIPRGAVERYDAEHQVDPERQARLDAAAAEMATCRFQPRDRGAGFCHGCGDALKGFRRKWCSEACSDGWWVQHAWGFARPHAIIIAGGSEAPCARCGVKVGWLAEVNHIVPRNGAGYGRGCHHHQANLEVLCHDCHAAETTRQRRERRG